MKQPDLKEEDIQHAFNSLRSQIQMAFPLSDAAWLAMEDSTHIKFFPKKSFLVREGMIGRETGFIASGASKSYYITPDGNEVITRLYTPNDFCGPINFILENRSIENIEFVSDSWMLTISLSNIRHLYANYPEHLKIHDMMVQYYGRQQEEKVRDLQTLSVSQRLQKLLATTPHFFQYFTTSEVASFLGTERETLTRLRSKLQNAS